MTDINLAPTAPARRLAAVLFADIVGFTRLTVEDDAAAFRLAGTLQECSRRSIVREGGRVVRFVGDSVLAEFPSAESAVRGAFDLAREFEQDSATQSSAPATLHIGVHVGELTEAADGDIYGESVNLAARLQAEAAPRQILVSDDVWRQLRGRGAFVFESAGIRTLKGIAEQVRVHSVRDRAAVGEVADLSAGVQSPAAGSATVKSEAARPAAEPTPTRLIVLPFRSLRPDPEIDFLCFGLADSITATLSGLRSLVVRSSLVAQKYGGEAYDLRRIGQEAAVDLVLAGTLLKVGDRMRVTAQLAEAASGTVLWSESQQVTVSDIFQLQDDLMQRVVSSVSTPLTKRERRLIARDVPATARGYELYLRANEMSLRLDAVGVARDLYIAALEEDPEYAPAWARLGRCHRLVAKYTQDKALSAQEVVRAEAAFKKALELNPDLPIGHHYYAQFEVERSRPREAMVRLLQQAGMAPDAQLFAALVHALRYCGLLEESVTAHQAAKRMDPGITTSVEFTLLVLGRYEETIAQSSPTGFAARGYALLSLGRVDEAIAWMDAEGERHSRPGSDVVGSMTRSMKLALHGDVKGAIAILTPTLDLFPDAEGYFITARLLAHVGAAEESLALLSRLKGASRCEYQLRSDPWLESLRSDPRFPAILSSAMEGRERALTAFLEAGGPEVLEAGAR